MEIKKSPKADLENKRGLFLEIGLVVALVLVIGAFAVTPKEHRIEKVDLGYAPVEVEIVEVTREDQKPPEAPKKVDMAVVSDMLEVVTNDTKIETEIDFAEFDMNQAIEVAPVQTEEVFEEEIFIIVEEKASFMGGDEGTFRNWVQQTCEIPRDRSGKRYPGEGNHLVRGEYGRFRIQYRGVENPRQYLVGRGGTYYQIFSEMDRRQAA